MVSWIYCYQFSEENGQIKLIDAIVFFLFGEWLVEFFLGWWVNF